MSQYFPKPYEPFGRDINVNVDLFNYATKSDLASLKVKVDEIDVEKSKPVPANLSKLSNVVNNEVVKKTLYEMLVAKVNSSNISGFVLKTKYNTDKSDLEIKISDADKKNPDTSGLVKKKTDYSAKITEIKSKIPSISGLATNSALTAVKKQIPDVSNLVKRPDYNKKTSEIE